MFGLTVLRDTVDPQWGRHVCRGLCEHDLFSGTQSREDTGSGAGLIHFQGSLNSKATHNFSEHRQKAVRPFAGI